MLLSTYRRRRYESDPGGKPVQVSREVGAEKATLTSIGIGTEPEPKNDARVQTLSSTPATEAQDSATQPKPRVIDPQTEFDEYGTELHRDARVWKVYVQETDKYDGDLVKSWNDIRENTLISSVFSLAYVLMPSLQAALFSAISTAFLIESSKMLQPDPADISARALNIISQTLLTLANGTQQPGSVTAPPNDSAQFVPSRAAICVNTLWYLSLSLSLATSFIAILSKDWCHSFMSGRTGHPYAQTFRRQQKWDMLEQWKMSELLAVLPSLIHVALLLFSVGLCILLWDMHSVVAIPVICVSGVAFGFYVCSSIAAIAIDFFPYPTIVSKLCRTDLAQLTFRYLYQVITEGFPLAIVCGLHSTAWYLIYLGVRPVEYLVDHLSPILDRLRNLETTSQSVRVLVCTPSRIAGDWLETRALRKMHTSTWINSWFAKPNWTLDWTKMTITVASSGDNYDMVTGEQTSLALSWLIKNCETPQSVDIALQSIAGATNRIPPQPLLDCRAPLQILRRLASSNLYRNLDAKSESAVSLYVRSLSFLGTSTSSLSDKGSKKKSGLQASIWDLQMESERKLATLIEVGDFEPTQQNVDALRIGNTVASSSLKILQRKLVNADVQGIFDSIIKLLKSHRTHKLHNAALLSLTHAAILLLLLSPMSIVTGRNDLEPLPELSITTGNFPENLNEYDSSNAYTLLSLCSGLAEERRSGVISSLATICILLYNTAQDRTRQGGFTWLEEVLRGLIEKYSQEERVLQSIYYVKPPDIRAPARTLDPQNYFSRNNNNLLIGDQTQNFVTRLGTKSIGGLEENMVLSELRALHEVYYRTPVAVLSPAIYVIFVEIMCRTPPSSPLFACGAQMLSKCPFPTLSEELATALEQRDLVPLLETTRTSDNETKLCFAQGQLWLLLSLYIYAGDTASGRDKLKVELDKCGRNGGESEEVRHRKLRRQLVAKVKTGNILARELGVWAWRLEECVHQSYPAYIEEYIRESLRDVPPELRGLSSFTAWPLRAGDPSTNEPRSVGGVTDEARERTDSTNMTIQGEGVAGRDGHLQGAGLAADTGEAETQEEDDAGRADSSQDLEAATQGPTSGDGKSLAGVNSQEEVGEVRGEGNSGVEAEGDERRVADAGDAAEETNGSQSEGEEAESHDVGQGEGNEGDVVIRMDRLENRSDGPTTSA